MWDIFFSEVLTKMSDAKWGSSNEWASYFAKKYDECMKRGFDFTTKNPVKNGNVELMAALLQSAANIALNAKEDSFYNTYYGLIGNAVVGYWTGAELQTTSIPLTPANGTLANLYVTSNIVTDTASEEFHSSFAPPIKNVEQFLTTFINLARAHLDFVGGVCYTFSQYPSPLPPGRGVLNWKGYKVELGNIGYGRGGGMFELNQEDFKLSQKELEWADKEMNKTIDWKTQIEQSLKNTKRAFIREKQGLDAANEFINLQQTKINSGLNINKDAIKGSLAKYSYVKDDDALGARIAAWAMEAAKLPVLEDPDKPNHGPWVDMVMKRIGMLGTDPDAAKPNTGYKWCAGACSYWYSKAGALIPTNVGGSGPAACVRWQRWAQENGKWTKTPGLGYAIIYKNLKGEPIHIGVVIDPNPDENGRITTIEGNTSSTEFNADGGGVFVKQPLNNKILGFVIPTDDPSWLYR